MELYTLDESLRRDAVVEGYEALVWTERYSAWGDFVLEIPATREVRNLLPVGTHLSLSSSYRVMVVETIEETTNDAGEEMIEIQGRSLEALLDDRVAMPAFAGLETTSKWEITDTPVAVVKHIFNKICVEKVLNPGDGIPFYKAGNLLPLGTIPAPSDPVTIALDPDTLYNSIKKICDIYNLGFRIVRNLDKSEVFFEVYTGDNRQSNQSALPAVVFSPELDNLTNTSQLESSANLKNVAYVFGKNDTAIVYGTGVDPESSGFERRVLIVKASDIELPAGEELTAALQQKGLEELSKHRVVFNFDGEIPETGSYVYGQDYNLGDLVEQRNADGFGTEMRVTEQIFVSDVSGDRSYPTLSVNVVVNPGTWRSWASNQTWSAVDPEIYWANA